MAEFITSKVNGNTVGADEWNQLASINNTITQSGQTPSTGDLTQLGKASATYAASSTFYTDGGAADAYLLTSINSLKAPNAYVDGMMIRFRAGNINTGSSTVNVATIGVVNLKAADGTTNLVAGDIRADRDSEFRYNNSAGAFAKVTPDMPTVQEFTSGSATYTTPSGVKWINVKLVGAGGGGASSATVAAADASTGGTGGDSTFGTTLLDASGGVGGAANTSSSGGGGGAASLGSGPIGIALQGGRGNSGGVNTNSSVFNVGGNGAASAFGGSGGSIAGGAGVAGRTNTGGGGGGASAPTTGRAGGGGGAGGFIDAIINSPDATYSYAVGAAGTGATAGTGGSLGGAGGSGYIIVTEHY